MLMATTTKFKQQCPHCEARVPIKDEKMIGEEINCPKCRKPFVVEDPGDEEADEEPKDAKKSNGKASKSAAKLATRDEDDEEKPKKKGDGGKTKLIVWGGIAAVGFVILGVTAFLMTRDSGNKGQKPQPPGPGAGAAPNLPVNQPNAEPPKPAEETKPAVAAAPAATVSNLTNLLPPDTESVVTLSIQEILKFSQGRTLLQNAQAGRREAFERNMGIPVSALERVVLAGNQNQDWTFIVARTTGPVKMDAIKAALSLKAESPIQGLDYFVTPRNWVVGQAFQPANSGSPRPAAAPGTRPMYVRLHDSQTLICADRLPMLKFLQEKGQWPTKSKAPEPTSTPTPAGGAPSGAPPAANNPMPPMGSQPALIPKGSNRPGGAGGPPNPGAGAGAPPAPAPVSADYLTINPRLKGMLDKMEAKPPFIFSMAGDLESNRQALASIPGLGDLSLNTVGLGLQARDHGPVVTAGIECANETEATNLKKNLDSQISLMAPMISALVNIKVETGATGGGMGPGGMTGPGGFRPPTPPAGNVPPMPPPNAPAMPPNNPGQPGMQRPPAGQQRGPSLGTLKIGLVQQEKTVSGTFELQLDPKVIDKFNEQFEPALLIAHGAIEMATAHSNPTELGAAIHQFAQDAQHALQFPRGAADRKASEARAGRPWPPDQRVSWMAELLPYLGYEGLYSMIKPQRDWKEIGNGFPSMSLIPAFLDSDFPPDSWYCRYPGIPYELAATHYVGIAGVGLDAADYRKDDPTKAKLLGIFGYDRETKLSEITDGLSNTILMAQIPYKSRSPWIAGGGSTVRGVPETKSVQPFVSTQGDGKRGTFVVMADGSVRFVSENISDEVFKAMCTIKGGEKTPNLDKDAPLVNGPESAAPAKPADQPKPADTTKPADGPKPADTAKPPAPPKTEEAKPAAAKPAAKDK
jgi:hypothetical protein